MRAGSIHRTGAELACVPSHLVVVVEGTDGRENGVDAVP
jgi:hypothetical protein